MTRSTRVQLALVAVVAIATSSAAPAAAGQPGDLGLGLYQATAGRSFVAYPSLAVFLTPEFLLQFGFDASTHSQQNYGFMTRFAFAFAQRGEADVMIGGTLEIREVGRNEVVVGPMVGVQAPITSDLTVVLDAYPFAISGGKGGTDAFFLEGRVGFLWWFR